MQSGYPIEGSGSACDPLLEHTDKDLQRCPCSAGHCSGPLGRQQRRAEQQRPETMGSGHCPASSSWWRKWNLIGRRGCDELI